MLPSILHTHQHLSFHIRYTMPKTLLWIPSSPLILLLSPNTFLSTRCGERRAPARRDSYKKKTWLLLLCMLASFSPPQKSHRKSPLYWCYRCIKVFYCRWAYNRFRFNAYPSTAASQARTL